MNLSSNFLRNVALLLLAASLFQPRSIQAQTGPVLNISRAGGNVTLSWSNSPTSFILEQVSTLKSLWTPVTPEAQLAGNQFIRTVSASGTSRFFRLRERPLTTIAETSPANGESGVAVTRETVFRFTSPLATNTLLGPNHLYAAFGGRRLLSRLELSTDRKTLTLFYLENLPGSARMRVTFSPSGLQDALGRLVDVDGDGQPGGIAEVEFDTLSITPVAGTAVIGTVFASEQMPGTNATNFANRPLRGVTITVDGMEQTLRTVTDSNGNFRLAPAPAGDFFVHIDGRTLIDVPAGIRYPDLAYYPFVGKSWNAVAGSSSNLAGGTGLIYLPLIVQGTLEPVSMTNATVITFPPSVLSNNPALAGVTITVPANSLFSDNGTRGGEVGIAPVPADRLPGPLPPGLSFPLVITIQTDGPSNFDRPVPVRFPNLPDAVTGQRLPPGAKSALWSFNHDTGEWEVVGPMTVTADGNFVETDPGFGVLQPGWHGSAPGGQMSTPLPVPCPGFGWGDAWDLAKASFDCIKEMTRALQLLAGAVETIHTIKTLHSSIETLRDDYRQGSLTRAGVKALLEGFKQPKEQAKTQWEGMTALNPVSKAVDVAKCASGIIKVIIEKLCNNAACAGRIAEIICAGAVPASSLADLLIQKADDLDKSIRAAPLVALCAAFDLLIAELSGAPFPAPGLALAEAPDPDPALLLLLDNVVAETAAFETNTLAVIETVTVGENLRTQMQQVQEDGLGPLLVGTGGFLNSHYRLIVNATELRGQVNGQGQLVVRVPPNSPYRLEILNLVVNALAISEGVTVDNGRSDTFAPFRFVFLDGEPDQDNDGVANIAEPVVGTDPANADTDLDGILDGAEILQGTNPLDGRPVTTGVIASAPTPGTAIDICAINDVVIVASGGAGVTVFNVSSGENPIAIAQFDTPGDARRVTCSGDLIAIADGAAGMAVADISDPARARIIHQVSVPGGAEAVASAGGIAFVGTGGGQVVAVDMNTGSILQTVDAGGFVHDLAIEGDSLFALTASELIAWSIAPDFLQFQGRVPHVRFAPEGITGRKRLAVGGGYAYATVYPGYDVFDVANRAAMQHVGLSMDAGPNSFKQIVPNGSGLGIAAVGTNPRDDGTHDVNLYDLSDPTQTTRFLVTLVTPGVARALSVYNGLAYVADGASGLQVVNYLPYDSRRIAPAITLATSATGNLVEEGKLLRLTAAVTDDVQVRNVEFYVDAVKVVTDGNFPFEHRFVTPLATPTKSTLTVRARATDTGGNATWSAELVLQLVADATPPRLRSVTPRVGAILSSVSGVAAFFSEPLMLSSIHSNTFRLTWAGPDGQFGTIDDQQLTPNQIEFRDEVLGAFLQFGAPLAPGVYRAEVTSGLNDLAGLGLANPMIWNLRVFSSVGDRDGDGLPDSLETLLGLNPDNPDTNGNGVPDGDEDFDGDGLSNRGELLLGYDPGVTDSDGDGVPDGAEDFDNDGIPDGEEVVAGTDGFITDPLLSDTDGDGTSDGAEVAFGLNPVNPADANATIVVNGRTITVNGEVRLNSLLLTNGAVLTHPFAGARGQARLDLNISNLTVDASSRIDVTGRGYLGAQTAGNPSDTGRTLGNIAGSTSRNGGSYGGLGAIGNVGGTANDLYADYRNPNELGSGGGGAGGSPGGNGGGLVQITSAQLIVEGTIAANGGNGAGFGGGGSGGGIKITTTSLSGAGSITANGGNGDPVFGTSGGGGGGRIAIFYPDNTLPGTLRIESAGGIGLRQGAPGTLYTVLGTNVPQTVIRGTGRETPLPNFAAGEAVILDGARVVAQRIETAELRLINGAVLTHPPISGGTGSRLDLVVSRIVVETNSAINVAGRGYLGAQSGENATDSGRTLGNVAGSTARNGGSYGGLGAIGSVGGTANGLYGDYRNPNELGSGGGGAGGSPGGNGGGLVQITSAQLIVEGTIAANGGNGSGFGGGGSGGGIKITTTSLSGAGSIIANGGNGDPTFGTSGGGGGGRIAIVYPDNTLPGTVRIESAGGIGLRQGAPGTLYLVLGTNVPQTVIRGTGRETPLPNFVAGEVVILDGARVAAQRIETAELRLINGAVLTHVPITGDIESRLDLVVSRIFIETNSAIDVTGRGYLGAQTAGNPSDAGRTLGNIAGSTSRNGGSYGGLGAIGNVGGTANDLYADYRNPNELGSGGGGAAGSSGGNGGGLVQITSAQLIVEGTISANGGNGGGFGGGGSGGGIKITTTSLSGAGSITANGGNGDPSFGTSGGGGGGRIAIFYPDNTLPDTVRIESAGGIGLRQGAPGTLYLVLGTNVPQTVIRGTGRETPLPNFVAGEVVILDGARVAAQRIETAELRLINGAVLTHVPITGDIESRLDLVVSRIFIETNSAIDVTGRGYLGAQTAGNPSDSGRTLGNIEGSTPRNGGSYGGLGAIGNVGGTANDLYGDYRNPNELGSGGGGPGGSPGGNGGGLVQITSAQLIVEGTIAANGGNGGGFGGGGSGGGIKITTTSLSGAGSIIANGGNGDPSFGTSGGGGGGRIAIFYPATPDSTFTNVQARGGTGRSGGAPGTLYRKVGTALGQLVIRGSGRETPLPQGGLNDVLIVDGAAVFARALLVNELTLQNGAVLTHLPATTNSESRLEVVATNVTIDAASRIDVSERGYLGALRGDNPDSTGRTLGNIAGSTERNGGSYGGLGALGNIGGTVNNLYGDAPNPNELGSGGGGPGGSPGGNGGGLVQIISAQLIVEGTIAANGGNGSGFGGGGSGGGIKITTTSLSGAGSITTNGGNGDPAFGTSGGGGGGRIAIFYSTESGSVLANAQAPGGTGFRAGDPGTVHRE